MIRNQLQHSLLEGFNGNRCCQNATEVVRRSSHTFAFFLPLLHSLLLPIIVQPLAIDERGLLLIFFIHHDLIVAGEDIHET